jgi:citrate lyase subunit gamma (acyl carrier protein)
MEIIQKAQAGSFESSDILVLIEPNKSEGRKIEIKSSVMYHYGDKIKSMVDEILDFYKIEDIHLIINDKGAIDATIKARLETAILRATKNQKGTLVN